MISISKQTVEELKIAPLPEPETVSQIRTGKPRPLGQEVSAIWKQQRQGLVAATRTGFVNDEHITPVHGGIERAVHQYSSQHYPTWRAEQPEHAKLFEVGAFGENLTTKTMNEDNVCVGDIYSIRDEIDTQVLLEVSEPRMPCYKLNMRFQNSKMLKTVLRNGQVGWQFRVLKTGNIKAGDSMMLVKRPNPRWSVKNVHRVVHGKTVSTDLMEELADLKSLSTYHHDLVLKRLATASRTYTLVDERPETKRVKHLTFKLKTDGKKAARLRDPDFRPFSFAQIKFGPDLKFSRSYSIVSGDLYEFCLGVALDDHSRGGSRYLHKELQLGDEIQMAPGVNQNDEGHEAACGKEEIRRNIVIIGGIGVTAFLPVIKTWQKNKTPFEVHYAVRSLEEAAFLNEMPANRTKIYARTRNERLNVQHIIPGPSPDGSFHSRLFVCGPTKLMDACEERAKQLQYPEHLLHFESFGSATEGDLGDRFEVEIEDDDRSATLTVPSDKSLLHVLQDAGFDVMSSCEAGTCGTCKVSLCSGEVIRKGVALAEEDKESCILSCVDRGVAKIKIGIE
ncbi:hypothetical protein PRZ48_006084 [Zasmidium cellare]|uniref:Uncharacterized protein n=1 Tax=Zasmidium cellare TaxID=395010 RepID=A0ABR0EPC4_ZASCE|nr:hypothetical protein PRZ48_006084 [Zasmidium cellare]